MTRMWCGAGMALALAAPAAMSGCAAAPAVIEAASLIQPVETLYGVAKGLAGVAIPYAPAIAPQVADAEQDVDRALSAANAAGASAQEVLAALAIARAGIDTITRTAAPFISATGHS